MRAKISLRVHVPIWRHDDRLAELLALLDDFRGTVDEVAFFTGMTHCPLPLDVIERYGAELAEIIPSFKAAGLSTGINHLATIGHLDENLENSLDEPWQRMVDLDGSEAGGSYCTAEPAMLEYVKRSYAAFAAARPHFIWGDDDIRMEHHGPNVRFACFCPRCMADFSAETGTAWTRETLRAALDGGDRAARLALRRQWLEHNRQYIGRLLDAIRSAVDAVDPAIELGLMTGDTVYSGYGFDRDAAALAGKNRVDVKWRPGGGFYSDNVPLELLHKAHSIGRQVALLPRSVADIQSEHENFPYYRLKKSLTMFTAEIAAYIGAGCTGTALNCLAISPASFGEYRPIFAAVQAQRSYYDRLVETFGRSPCEGFWPAFTRDHFAALNADGEWGKSAAWGTSLALFNELTEIGLPITFSREGAALAVLAGDMPLQFTRDELIEMLSGGVLLDGPALARLGEMGLSELAGFAVAGTKERDTIEQFTADPINGQFGGWQRDCRPSFWPQTSYLLRPLTPASRVLSHLIDFTPTDAGPVSGAFENARGGRVAVLGYYPWAGIESLVKTSQLKTLFRWLSRDSLPACVPTLHRVCLWCRRDPAGRPAVLILNASIDRAEGLRVCVRGASKALALLSPDGAAKTLAPTAQDGPYGVFEITPIPPWQTVLLRAAPQSQ